MQKQQKSSNIKRFLLFCIAIILIPVISLGQYSDEYIQGLKEQLQRSSSDSAKANFLYQIAYSYRFSNVDSSLLYAENSSELEKKLKIPALHARLTSLTGAVLLEMGKIPESLQYQFESLKTSEKLKDPQAIARALNRIGNTYMELMDYTKANEYYFRSAELFLKLNDTGAYHNEWSNIGNVYELLGMTDSALYYQKPVYEASLKTNDRDDYTIPEILFRMGNIYLKMGAVKEALEYYQRGVIESQVDNDLRNNAVCHILIAKIYQKLNLPDSVLKYGFEALGSSKKVIYKKGISEATFLISYAWRVKNLLDSAFYYLSLSVAEKDELYGPRRFQELQKITLDEFERNKRIEEQRIIFRNRIWQFLLVGGMSIFFIIAAILYRNNKQKKVINEKLSSTLNELRSTQSQLIQSEKMASLGELTAGIAHEIQNPLNFVNNFSEINKELLDEIQEERKKEKKERNEQLESELISSLKENEDKINQHGKRADAIVKSMLQHSKSGSGKKEPTDLNALFEEYLGLAYHNYTANDKGFQCAFSTELDPALPKLNVVPQDIGRVLLNMMNNAFWACAKKSRGDSKLPLDLPSYTPTITITTKKLKDSIEIRIRDNGIGIPPNLMDKIFQPFFTTKPTGEGTGLGLSLAYDIIKAHGGTITVNSFNDPPGGEIKVESMESEARQSKYPSGGLVGQGSEFIIQLPL